MDLDKIQYTLTLEDVKYITISIIKFYSAYDILSDVASDEDYDFIDNQKDFFDVKLKDDLRKYVNNPLFDLLPSIEIVNNVYDILEAYEIDDECEIDEYFDKIDNNRNVINKIITIILDDQSNDENIYKKIKKIKYDEPIKNKINPTKFVELTNANPIELVDTLFYNRKEWLDKIVKHYKFKQNQVDILPLCYSSLIFTKHVMNGILEKSRGCGNPNKFYKSINIYKMDTFEKKAYNESQKMLEITKKKFIEFHKSIKGVSYEEFDPPTGFADGGSTRDYASERITFLMNNNEYIKIKILLNIKCYGHSGGCDNPIIKDLDDVELQAYPKAVVDELLGDYWKEFIISYVVEYYNIHSYFCNND